MVSYCLSLARLFFSLCTFQSSLKLSISPANSSAKILFPLQDMWTLLPEGLLLYKLTPYQKLKILLSMPVLKPVVHLHYLPVSCHIIPCNWQDRGAHNLSFTSLDQLFQDPEVLLGCLQPSPLCCLPGKPVEVNNQWAGPGWKAPSWCPLPGLQGANTLPVCWAQWTYQTPQKGISNNYKSFFVKWEGLDDWFYQSISSSESQYFVVVPLHFSAPLLGWAVPDDTSCCYWCNPCCPLGAAPGSVTP